MPVRVDEKHEEVVGVNVTVGVWEVQEVTEWEGELEKVVVEEPERLKEED